MYADILHYGAIFLISVFGAILQGSIGFGLGPFAVPLLVLIDPGFIPGPLLLVSMYLTFSLFRRERQSLHKEGFGWAIGGRILGSVLGAGLLLIIPSQNLSMLYGSVVLFAVFLSVSGLKLKLVSHNILFAATLSGMMATSAAIGGPPMALVYQHGSGPRLRSTLSAIFLIGSLISIFALIWIGKFGEQEIIKALILIPGIALGVYLSKFSATILDKGYIRPAIMIVSTLSAAVLIFNSI